MTRTPDHRLPGPVLDELLESGKSVHFVGIGGVGMAGLAYLLHSRGIPVSGCDVLSGGQIPWLVAAGIEVALGHSASHLNDDTGWLVYTPAVAADSPELVAARRLKIPAFRRGDVLPALFHRYPNRVAVAGTHGKTTTSTFLSQLLHTLNRPSGWCIGGEAGHLGAVAGSGDGQTLVVEADESDGSLVNYHPDVGVITNIEFDHMENFDGCEALEDCFRQFAGQVRRTVVFGADDPRAVEVVRQTAVGRARGFGLVEDAAVRAENVVESTHGIAFDWWVEGACVGRVELPVPGRHNLLNALAAAAVCLELGLDDESIRDAMGSLSLPRRRLEVVASGRGVEVISDYAHHPTEIAACVGAVCGRARGRLVAVFQPHRYSRTRALGPEFPPAFRGIGELTLVPVYAASERPLDGGSIWDLYERVAAVERNGSSGCTKVAPGLEQAWLYWQHQLRDGDVLLLIGAGDVERIGPMAREWLESEGRDEPLDLISPLLTDSRVVKNEPLSRHTTLRVGGPADLWVELGSSRDTAELLKYTLQNRLPLRLLGGGSNILPDDLGFRGVVAHPRGGEFAEMRLEGDTVVAGGAVTVGGLLNWLQNQGLGGLEFLEGIPATLGGCLRMNAGAFDEEIKNHVSWIRGLNRDGSPFVVANNELEWYYRDGPSAINRVLVEAGLTVTSRSSTEVESMRRHIREQRRWMAGLHSAGSVFKNPPDEPAGRLLDTAGAKQMRVGGASVAARHANVIVTEPGATASDVRALMRKMRRAVQDANGVRLEPEIRVWDSGGDSAAINE